MEIVELAAVMTTLTSQSQHTQKTYKIFHKVNCSSAYVVYLVKYKLFKKQYVEKAEIPFNIRLNRTEIFLKILILKLY